jgi:hypothetical protein
MLFSFSPTTSATHGVGCGNGQRPRNNGGANIENGIAYKILRPDDSEYGPKNKNKGKNKGNRGSNKQRGGRRVNFNALVKALTSKELHRNNDD